ncbi:next to BRCA1 gene 1 protein isoform X2 [Rhineura floridana]|uniref:next to BRCA1 gene 1 protein isoform X2 n=1 Tax=Rhineura floridana TaxID=261503 RepID=UPI002AC85660|nr:next to BRCA1 gene 1 protein isoform X2 [Rhineura floridana]
MDPQVNLSVTFQGDTQSFLVSDSSNTTWADVEAMVKVSFELNDIQIKYLDEDHDEVSVNTAEEYEEALKIAVKQGNRLQMNVYETSAPSGMPSQQAPEKTEKIHNPKDGRKPLAHYSMLPQTLAQDKDTERENGKKQSPQNGHHPTEAPPEWFTSYLERFREQVVQETVETLEQKLSEKLLLSSQLPSSLSSSTHQAPVSPLVQGNPFDWLLSCSNCQTPIVGIRYQCSVCPSYSICELCEAGMYAHDPNHVLLKLRRPVLCISETYNLGQFSPRFAALEQVRLQKQMDKRFLKAEKQHLRAEKKQRKAEVRELKKQMKLHRKIHLWNSVHTLDNAGLTTAKSESLQPNTLLPLQGCSVVVPTLSAAFVDENLPDGTLLQPRTTFIKHWRMRNTGNMEWSSDTKLKFMWGNLTLVSSDKKNVTVPSLLPGQEGVVSVEFVAPPVEGTYTSHWRLSHRGEQFGPRIWCSIVVDPSSSNTDCPENDKLMSGFCKKGRSHCKKEEIPSKFKVQTADSAMKGGLASRAAAPKLKSILSAREFYIPSVDLLTAQDLLSFELLDINIVQELEQVPHNTPVDAQVGKGKAENPANQEEGEEDMSGTQFVCETVIRSLTLDAAPDHRPPQKQESSQGSVRVLQNTAHYSSNNMDPIRVENGPVPTPQEQESKNQGTEVAKEPEFENLLLQDGEELSDGEAEDDAKDEVCSQVSCTSSEDYIIILPECFDTSRPLGESMYSSALSQPSLEKVAEASASPGEESHPPAHSINDILTTSQTLDDVPLNPQILEPQPARSVTPSENNGSKEASFPSEEEAPWWVPDQTREVFQGAEVSELLPAGNVNNTPTCPEFTRHTHSNSLAGDLVKGALSVAASAYKALFAGLPSMEQVLPVATEDQMAPFLANLSEMGFCDRLLNLRLLRKHNCDMAQVVTELLQLSHSDWYGN